MKGEGDVWKDDVGMWKGEGDVWKDEGDVGVMWGRMRMICEGGG